MSPADVATGDVTVLTMSLVYCSTCGATAFMASFPAMATDEYEPSTHGGKTFLARKFLATDDTLCNCRRDMWIRIP